MRRLRSHFRYTRLRHSWGKGVTQECTKCGAQRNANLRAESFGPWTYTKIPGESTKTYCQGYKTGGRRKSA